jgi:hypothetical protein
MRTSVVLAVGWCVAAPAPASADTDSWVYCSLEWLVDSSDSVVEATVVCELVKGPGGWAWKSRVKSRETDRVFKRVGKNPPVAGDLTDVVRVAGEHRVLLFSGPPDRPPEGGTYVIFLSPPPAPKDPANPPDPFDHLAARDRVGQPLQFYRPACAAIDKAGKVLTDPAAVVAAVEARVKLYPERVRAAGHYVGCGPRREDPDVHFLYVPHEPEHRKGFLDKLKAFGGPSRHGAAIELAHYPGDRDVAAALKAALADGYVAEEQGPPGPKGEARPVKVYPVRRAAYRSLQALGVNVPQPELAPAP